MLTRRTLLHTSAVGLAAVLLGCESSEDTGAAVPSADPTTPAAGPVAPTISEMTTGTALLIDEVAPDRSGDLSIINASFETLTGDGVLFPFGLVGLDNVPVRDAEVQVWTRPADGEPASGPFDATFHDIPGQDLGLYSVSLDLPVAGAIPLVALTADGVGGETVMNVADPDSAVIPAPGTAAISVSTPTEGDLQGFERLCTLDPPCGMHDVSLDEALADGDPVMLVIATPGFCQTAICGPTVEVAEAVRTSESAPADVTWIHLEVFTDAGTTIADQVTAWQLQSEPWIFGIGADGMIRGRLDGPLTVLDGEIDALSASIA
jgi:hypothetical protein